MSKPDKSYWLGATVLFLKLIAAGMFLVSCFIGIRWFQAQGFSGQQTLGGIWSWLWDDKNKDSFEPLLALLTLIGSLVPVAITFALERLHRKDSEAPKIVELRGSELADWERVRPKLINVVRQDWVKAHLDRNLAKRAWIHLGVEEVPDDCTLSLDIEFLAEQRQELVTGQSLIRLFDESGGRLLILGEPGSGKTITLVKLCEALLERAERDAASPVPVGLRLASWAISRLPFEEWLAAELKTQNLGSKVILNAVESDQIILLLDGLDEVAPMARSACLAAIESYRKTRTVPLVVCCRWEEYQSMPGSFTAIHALRILPLMPVQIDFYLSGFHGKLENLRHHLTVRAELRELSTTPLMLSILARVYLAGGEIADLPDDAPVQAWRNVVFERYVRIMFDRKGYDPAKTHVTRSQAIHYLQQIARCMRRWNLPVLYLEHLHCGWLHQRWRFVPFAMMGYALFEGQFLVSAAVLIAGLNDRLLDLTSGILLYSLVLGLKLGTFSGLFSVLSVMTPSPPMVVERVRITWKPIRFVFGLVIGILVALFTGSIYLFLSWLDGGPAPELLHPLCLGIGSGLVFWLLEFSVDPEPAAPNQGIQSSLRTATFASALFSVAGLAIGYPFSKQSDGALLGLLFGFLVFGGGGVLDHWITRVALASEGTMPFPLRTRSLIVFLDAMSELILVRRVGGGWSFAHGLLLEYLSDEPFGPDPKTIEKRL